MKALELLKQDRDYGLCIGNDKAIIQKYDEAIEELEAFKNKTCENCKFLDVGPYDICPIAEPLSRQCMDYDESTFSCNQWEPKDE